MWRTLCVFLLMLGVLGAMALVLILWPLETLAVLAILLAGFFLFITWLIAEVVVDAKWRDR